MTDWVQAVRVAIVGFSVVFAGLCLLALSVKVTSFFCRLVEKKGKVR
jgi:Na+-transporting methylmalonyl-CoA/oxaloacetate decarboxylase gamma subunit